MKSGKDIGRVSLARMRRAFVGTYSTTTRNETWIECGHFLEGVELSAEEIFEIDGDAQIAEETGFFLIDGTATPAQNTVDDFAFYNQYLKGKRQFCFWCDDNQLWFFKTYYQGNKRFIDDRISIFPKHGYTSPRQQEQTKFSGCIGGFEILKVQNFHFANSKITYDKVLSHETFGNLRPVFFTKGAGNNDK
jgi:hypothetical protein